MTCRIINGDAMGSRRVRACPDKVEGRGTGKGRSMAYDPADGRADGRAIP